MPSLVLSANAKVNLGLHILGRRADGYHLMETLYYPVPELADEVELEAVAGEECVVRMEGFEDALPLEQNLCWRAWNLLAQRYQPIGRGMEIVVRKRIPAGAGLGGGSSDAAAVLKGLRTIWRLTLTDGALAEMGASLGADVPFFIYNVPMYATGIGTELEPYPLDLAAQGLELRVRTLPLHSSTPAAFKGLNLAEIPDGPSLKELLGLPVARWQGLVRNDLEQSVLPRMPLIGQTIDNLKDEGALYAGMTGSGSACFGIFQI